MSIQHNGVKTLKEFTLVAEMDERVKGLKVDVEEFATQFSYAWWILRWKK